LWSGFFWLRIGIRKGGTSAHTGAKTCWGEHVFSPWENPLIAERIRRDVNSDQLHYSKRKSLLEKMLVVFLYLNMHDLLKYVRKQLENRHFQGVININVRYSPMERV
jgi:hypothetical protein